MLSNPDTALPLYLLVVITGIMLGKGWRPFLDQIASAGRTTQSTSVGSAATTGGVHG